ncbi:MAG: hypothetical protein L6R35_003609 [Caloplaca aegaea]|nr:MAG: hypothetical protein L6R35_003609 [Caloplaca aegaea]
MGKDQAPTIALVPGAYHVASSLDPLTAQLEQSGWKTRTMALPSVNRPDLSLRDDILALTNCLLRPLIVEEGADVVLYMHSYAGFVASAAIAGLSKSERSAKGQEGGIIGLIYQSAFIPTEGDTVNEMIGGQPAPWVDVDMDKGLARAIDPKQTFYHDVPEPLATEATKKVLDQSIGIYTSPSGPVFYGTHHYDNRRAYIHTTNDMTLPPADQEKFVKNSGVEWDVRKIDMSHSPFLSEPAESASMVVEMTKGFIATY